MKKLRLQLDELQVESFHTVRTEPARGTVRANAPTWYCTEQIDCTYDYGCETQNESCNGSCATCFGGTCENTCYNSCNGTCNVSCYGTCDASCNTCEFTCYESGCACTVQWSACGVYACP